MIRVGFCGTTINSTDTYRCTETALNMCCSPSMQLVLPRTDSGVYQYAYTIGRQRNMDIAEEAVCFTKLDILIRVGYADPEYIECARDHGVTVYEFEVNDV